MNREEINMRKKAIAIFEGYSVTEYKTGDLRFWSNTGQEIDPNRFRYESSFDILIPVGQKILLAINPNKEINTDIWGDISLELGEACMDVGQLNLYHELEEWFISISDFCIEWCKHSDKKL